MNWQENDMARCLDVLQNGGLILYPTDTIWGIGCDATDAVAIDRIYKLKQREDTKAMIVLLAEEKDIYQHVAGVDPELFDYLEKQKKPTTVIYDGAIGLAENLVAADGSIAIRICRDPFCRQLLKRFRKPLVSTSANISGTTSPVNYQAISPEIKIGVDYIVAYRQDDESFASPSTIIRWNKKGGITMIRP
jgi:L-threonylcarbamoyladenylate synthase